MYMIISGIEIIGLSRMFGCLLNICSSNFWWVAMEFN